MKRLRVALIANDGKKQDMLAFVRRHRAFLAACDLLATQGTCVCLNAELPGAEPLLSGPLGGDLQAGAQLASGRIAAVFFLRDPLTAHPHEADILALLRLCDVFNVPCATNVAGAELMIESLQRKQAFGSRRIAADKHDAKPRKMHSYAM
jgi:methylglyoxal synthase